MEYPLHLTFKIFTFVPQIRVADDHGNLVFYVRQKLFKLKESVTVYADEQQTKALCEIKADRIIDFSAEYLFTDTKGTRLGSVKRQGMASIWRARYDIKDGETPTFKIQEMNPMVKVFDGVLGEIPILGMFTGFFFHPIFHVTRPNGSTVLKVTKRRAFLESRFTIERTGDLDAQEELRTVLAIIMMVLLERARS